MMVKEETTMNEFRETLVEAKKMQEEDELIKSSKAKMDEVREENERLKLTLSQAMKDYQSLKMHFQDIAKKDHHNQLKITSTNDDESELVSLSLGGRFSGDNYNHLKKEEEKKIVDNNEELALGLDCRFHESSEKSSSGSGHSTYGDEECKTNESLKRGRSSDLKENIDDVLQQSPLKKPRVSIRAVCDTQTMNDGCQWRKYGQKIAKGNPCPRAYYRCTVSSSCPVRKQVQRCAEDMSILITTYEGTHNHPLPVAATAMASTTSAAAAMLKSGSSTSQPSPTATTNTANLHGLNFNFANNSPSTHQPFYFPKASITTSQSHPTVILDLTNNSSSCNRSLTSPSLFSTPRSSSACLDFTSNSNTQPSWISGNNQLGQGPFWHSYSNTFKTSQNNNNNNVTDSTIAEATKAIASDPAFQSALATAISSLVGKTGNTNNNVQWAENFVLNLLQQSTGTHNGVGSCGNSFLSRFQQASRTAAAQESNFSALFPPAVSFATTKSPAAMSLPEEGDINIKL